VIQMSLEFKKENDLDAKFNEFDRENPHIYEVFKNYTRQVFESGKKHYGAKAIFERIRWHFSIEKRGDFKVNNSYISRYARKLIAEQPQFTNFFECRILKS